MVPSALTPDSPQALEIGDTGSLKGQIILTERLGNETNVSLALPSGQTVLAVLDGDREMGNGETKPLTFDPAQAILFDGAGIARYPQTNSPS